MPIGNYTLALCSNLILFILPGLAWVSIFKKKFCKYDLVVDIVMVLSISLSICFIGLLGHLLLCIKVTSFSQVIFLAVITNIGLLIKRSYPRGPEKSETYKWVIPFFLIVYTAAYLLSTHVADQPFEDSDLDLQGTSYSLVNYLTPRMLTDRKTTYNFSHPLLPAFCAANTILLFDNIDNLKYYFDASIKAEKIADEEPFVGQEITFVSSNGKIKEAQIMQVNGDAVILDSQVIKDVKYAYRKTLPERTTFVDYNLIKKMRIWSEVRDSYKHFFHNPYLIATRSPQFLFTALSGLVLLLFLFKVTGSYLFSLIGSMFYLTVPEIFIAHSSTNYTAITSFVLIVAAYLYYTYVCDKNGREKMKTPLFFSGFLCAIVNHKTIILFLAILVRDIIIGIKRQKKNGVFREVYKDYIFRGFVFGVAAYWLYGWAIDAHSFILDHFQYHMLNRILHRNPFGYVGYFSISELWFAYSSNLGKPFFWIALFATAYYLRYLFKKSRNESILSLWFIIGAVVFTLIDFRQTVHLMYATPALVVLAIKWISERKALLKTLFVLVLTYTLILNAWIISEVITGSRDMLSFIRWL